MEALVLRDVSVSFGGVQALRDVGFTAQPGRITSLIGPNGSGKSTLFNWIGGQIPATKGSLRLGERDLTSEPAWKRARGGLRRCFQDLRIFPFLTVDEHLRLCAKDSSARTEALERVGIDLALGAKGGELSYGQTKLLAIAMALASKPAWLLLDEPVAGVSPALRDRLAALLAELRKDGQSILLIEHDMEFVMRLSDRVIALDRGTLVAEGSPETVRADPRVLGAYLGVDHA